MPRTGLTAEQIKEKAIEATLAKMREVGFDKVRLTDIAGELKVSHAALYAHFKDKSELLDAVSEKWLLELDEKLEAICRRKKDPRAKIHEWALAIHRAKLEKVRLDPQLYNAFNLASRQSKPFIGRHLENLHRQLLTMVIEAVEKANLNGADPSSMTIIISAALMAFHHPQLVAQYLDQDREPLLRQVLDSVLKGMLLK